MRLHLIPFFILGTQACFISDNMKNNSDAIENNEHPVVGQGNGGTDSDGQSTNPPPIDLLDINKCPTVPWFKAKIQPIQQNKCIICHKVGGRGGSKYILATGSSQEDLARNFTIARSKISEEDNGDYGKNPLIAYPLGAFGHDKIFSIFDIEFETFSDWIALERANPCLE